MSEAPIIFADALHEANIANNVARLRLSQITTEGRSVPAGTLIVPVSQLPALVNALGNLLRQLEVRARQAQAAAAERDLGPPAGTAD